METFKGYRSVGKLSQAKVPGEKKKSTASGKKKKAFLWNPEKEIIKRDHRQHRRRSEANSAEKAQAEPTHSRGP